MMKHCYVILTDSGGIQEEAPYLDKPVLVLRERSERAEANEAGCTKIVGTKKENIVNEFNELILNKQHYKRMQNWGRPARGESVYLIRRRAGFFGH